jgi:hypothetical protein
MSPTEQEIREALRTEFPHLQLLASQGSLGTLEIPAAHEAVGPLQIQIDPNEITVFVGPTHCHFEKFEESPPSDHIEKALEFIRGVLTDNLVLWSCLGAGGAYPVRRKSRLRVPWPVRRYLWSGPV